MTSASDAAGRFVVCALARVSLGETWTIRRVVAARAIIAIDMTARLRLRPFIPVLLLGFQFRCGSRRPAIDLSLGRLPAGGICRPAERTSAARPILERIATDPDRSSPT